MRCRKCGRVINNDAERCSGCGAFTDNAKMPAGKKLAVAMKSQTKLGGMAAYKVLILTLVLIVLAAGAVIAGPTVYNAAKNYIAGIEFEQPEQETPPEPSATDVVDKTGRFLYVDLSEAQTDCDEQYGDGSYKLHATVSGSIDLRVLRSAAAGFYAQVAKLYPGMSEEPEVFDEGMSIGGNAVTRAQIPAVFTENNCVVDIIFLTDGEYDHMLIIETPSDEYVMHAVTVEKLINSIAMYEMTYSASPSDAV